MKKLGFLFFFITVLSSCEKYATERIQEKSVSPFIFELPAWAPKPVIPEDNPLTFEKVELGKMLFQDKILSKNNDLSCSSCHNKNLAFSQNIALPKGDENAIGFRNSPSLINTVYNKNFFKDGGVKSLELQVLVPLETHFEFNLSVAEAVERLKNNEFYNSAFYEVFGNEPDVFGLTRAIAAYERTLVDFSTKYDKVIFEKTADFTMEELIGFNLFKANCVSCHNGINFTNQQYYNTGFNENISDLGRFRITRDSSDIGKFKTPNLRNVAITFPYMHDGRINTLEEVIEHYSIGGEVGSKSELKPMKFNADQKQQLIAFLKTLTSSKYVN